MNKTDFIRNIAEKSELDKKTASKAVDAMISTVSETLAKGDMIVIPGFGTFSIKYRAARTGRNPQTGQPLEIAAARVPHFKAGSKLKEEVSKD